MKCPNCQYPKASYRKTVNGLGRYFCPNCYARFKETSAKAKRELGLTKPPNKVTLAAKGYDLTEISEVLNLHTNQLSQWLKE